MYRLRVQELIYEAKQINYNMEKDRRNYNYNGDSDDESQKYDVGPPRLIRQQTCHFTPTEQCFPPPPRLRRQTNKPIMNNGIIEVEALTYIRGRSIANAFIIIDEAQQLTKHEIKTILMN